MKILIIDDSKIIINLIDHAIKLQYVDAKTVFAMNGLEAKNILTADKEFDLIFCDINMPIMNGLDFVQSMKEANIKIPTILVTSATAVADIDKAKSLGVRGYIVKPFSKESILAAIKKFVPGS